MNQPLLLVLRPFAVYLLLLYLGHCPLWIAVGGALLFGLPLFWPERRFQPYQVRLHVDLPWMLAEVGLIEHDKRDEVKLKLEESWQRLYCGKIATTGLTGYVLSCNAAGQQAVHWPEGHLLYTSDISLEIPVDLLPPGEAGVHLRYPWIFVKRHGRAYHIGLRVRRSWWEGLDKSMLTIESIAHRWNNPNTDEVEISLAMIPDFHFEGFYSLTWRSFYGREKLERRSKVKVYSKDSSGVKLGNLFVEVSIAELPPRRDGEQ